MMILLQWVKGIFSGMSALEELTIPFVGTKNYHSGTSQTTSYTHYPGIYVWNYKLYRWSRSISILFI